MFSRKTAERGFTLIKLLHSSKNIFHFRMLAAEMFLRRQLKDGLKRTLPVMAQCEFSVKHILLNALPGVFKALRSGTVGVIVIFSVRFLRCQRILSPKVPPPQSWKRVFEPGTSSHIRVFSGAILVINSPVAGSFRSET